VWQIFLDIKRKLSPFVELVGERRKKTMNTLTNQYLEHINAEDELQIILRGHLYIESKLIQLIKHKLQRPESIDLSKLNFPLKVTLTEALGLIDESEKGALIYLNKLRNRIAHNLEEQITGLDIDNFISTFNSVQREIYEFYFKKSQDHIYNLRKAITTLYFQLDGRLNDLIEIEKKKKEPLALMIQNWLIEYEIEKHEGIEKTIEEHIKNIAEKMKRIKEDVDELE
jgi:hypothetical protein